MLRVYLIGYMGVGKTTVGRKLADKLGLNFVDLDKFIENKYRKSISEIFAETGEEAFRRIEKSALTEVSEFENVVISTGGGAPCFYDNMQVMQNSGITVYIKAMPEELAERLIASKTKRPLVESKTGDELIEFIRSHLAQRERYYEQAQIIFETDRLVTKEHIFLTVDEIEKAIKEYAHDK